MLLIENCKVMFKGVFPLLRSHQ